MVDARKARRALASLAGITLLLLVGQYLLGVWVSLYAPASFSASASSPALGWHYLVGYALGVFALLLVIVAVLTRRASLITRAVVVLFTVGLAGVFGRLFVTSTPNNPLDSFGMALMFLIAFGSAISLVFDLRGSLSRPPPVPISESPPAAPS